MSKLKSIFLDIMRLSAALIVVFGHSMDFFYPSHSKSPYMLYNMSHFAVIIFFVLSGYVIGFTTIKNNRGPFQYAVARLSRLTSFVIPALIFTYFIELLLSFTSPIFITEFQRGVSLPRYLISASFLNELWFFSAAPPLNRPLWSVSFEFFYYVIFGVYFYTVGARKKAIFTFITCLIAGPKILVLLPIWLIGYLALKWSNASFKVNSFPLMLMMLVLSYLSYILIPAFPYEIGYKPFYFANQFLKDWVSGFFFAMSLWFFPQREFVDVPERMVKYVRIFADFTFPIYVLHYPIMLFCKGFFENKLPVSTQFVIAISLSIILSVGFGLLFDNYRHFWTKLFQTSFSIFKRRRLA